MRTLPTGMYQMIGKSSRQKLMKERLPLHHAAITLPDGECVEVFKKAKESDSWKGELAKVDRFSRNFLYITACEIEPKCFR